jgi:outer membrane protein assembly factor BamB
MDALTGGVKWKKDVIKDFNGKNITWGVNETLVIDGEKLFVTPGGPVNNMVALNKKDGSLIWSCKADGEPSAYCTPLLVKLPSKKLLVTHTEKHIIGVDAGNGEFLWSYEWPNQWAVHANTPIYSDGALFCFSGYGQGGVKFDLSQDGGKITKAWYNKKADSRIGGAVLVNGYIYLSGDNTRDWQCIDWKTGEQKYSSKAVSPGNIICADGMLYCYGYNGDLALVEAKPEAFNVISKFKMKSPGMQHWAHPVINDGRLYVRDNGELICYKIRL